MLRMDEAEPRPTTWEEKKKRSRKKRIWLAATLAVAAACGIGLGTWIQSKTHLPAFAPEASDSATAWKGLPVWDGKEFRLATDEEEWAHRAQKEAKYSVRLDSCMATPAEAPRLLLRITLDLQCDSRELMEEIQNRQKDLRLLVNVLISSKPLAEIKLPSLRADAIDLLNRNLKKGKLADVRFVEFKISPTSN